jgi:predicted metal-dependent hydrolase
VARGSPAVVPEPGEGGLEAAERHFHAAAELYRDGAGRDDAQEDMKLARRRLDEAQRILAQLPAEAPGVKDLRLKVQELLQNVIKDSGL